ncbi:ADP-ribose pyrophosphatase YjhB, NUDIX family [Pustulibacterium marinum]|uniref:ADP-ribose pyrophosphatase YjhB, NUDIX family n=2 Tax=Pustulibacterium marinum TaxID=1224947 RepID=A0A1I7HPH4_9FLAO|nr:ADP-ribose pyrophosphatase YjhB, NUDIX family [Pustulibacterium marinum]
MYEVFVNDHPIILISELKKEDTFKYFLLENVDLSKVIKDLNNGKMQAAYLYHPEKEQLIKKFKSNIKTVLAAGGVVRNKKGEILFIFRNGKWDLAKGKLDKGEKIEKAAIREVEEETGIKKLKLGEFFKTTYHIFKRNGVYKLKETHWYNMTSEYAGKLKPQEEEGITKVEWLNSAQIDKALQNSYPNIKKLFNEIEITAE